MKVNMENKSLLAKKLFLHFKDIKNRSYPLLLEKKKLKKH